MANVAHRIIAALKASGVERVYGLPGDSLNGFTDAIRRSDGISWEHARHEEAAAFAAAADAALAGRLAVCAGSCGPRNLHLMNGCSMRSAAVYLRWRSRRTFRLPRSARATSRRPTRKSCSNSAAHRCSTSARNLSARTAEPRIGSVEDGPLRAHHRHHRRWPAHTYSRTTCTRGQMT
jgi:Thiamine pyrophosphate enzyme, N-terminal TPP binding domain